MSDNAEDIRNIHLNADQQDAVQQLDDFMADGSQMFFRMDGSAGTGKSTTSAIWAQRQIADGKCIALSAPTNKATRNLRSMKRKISPTANIPVGTTYSLLGLVMGKDGEAREIKSLDKDRLGGVNALIVDERGMINTPLWGRLRDFAIEKQVKVILTGDRYQLPPVGEEESPTERLHLNVNLTKVERHDNQILTFATYLRDCIDAQRMPQFKGDNDENGGVFLMRGKDFYKQIRKAFSSDTYAANSEAFRVLAWRNATVADYIDSIRDEVYDNNPAEPFEIGERVVAKAPVMDTARWLYEREEAFMATTDEEGEVRSISVADHPVFSEIQCHCVTWTTDDGDTVISYVPTRAGKGAYNRIHSELLETAKSSGGRHWASYWTFKQLFAEMAPSHAMTVHRGQGSTYRTAFVDADDIMVNRNFSEMLRMFYTAATRPSKSLILKVS